MIGTFDGDMARAPWLRLCTYCASLNLTGTSQVMLRLYTDTDSTATGFVSTYPQPDKLCTAYEGYTQVALTWCICVLDWCMRCLGCTI